MSGCTKDTTVKLNKYLNIVLYMWVEWNYIQADKQSDYQMLKVDISGWGDRKILINKLVNPDVLVIYRYPSSK